MSRESCNNRTLAFAGILQALQLVQKTAWGRPVDLDALQASLGSILALDAASVTNVYGGTQHLAGGLRLVQTQLMGAGQRPDGELTRYLVTLLHLERKLSKRTRLLNTLRSGIERSQIQAGHFDITHANMLAGFADIYSSTVSTLHPRIMVNGDPARLRNTATANQVRALLLAAMRSAVLWRQCGGTRLGLLWGRGKLMRTAAGLLANPSA